MTVNTFRCCAAAPAPATPPEGAPARGREGSELEVEGGAEVVHQRGEAGEAGDDGLAQAGAEHDGVVEGQAGGEVLALEVVDQRVVGRVAARRADQAVAPEFVLAPEGRLAGIACRSAVSESIRAA